MIPVYKEIKRGGMKCTIWEHSGSYTITMEYKEEVRKAGPFADEDEAAQHLTEQAESWIDELSAGVRHRSVNGMRMLGAKK